MNKPIVAMVAAMAAVVTFKASGTEYTDETVTSAPWSSKVLLWVTAKDAASIDKTWKSNYVELWRDRRHHDSGLALGNYRRAESAVPVLDTSDAAHPNVDFKAYSTWATRLRPFEVENGEPIKGTSSDGNDEKFPERSIKFVIMVLGSHHGGGVGVMSNYKRGGDNIASGPRYSDPIFASDISSTIKNATWLNGYKVDPTVAGFNENSWHILSFKAEYSMSHGWYLGNTAASGSIGGGQKYGEVLLFTEEPTVAERKEIERYLARTWGIESDCRTSLWELPNTDYGETAAIQVTNVLEQAEAGDTLKFAAGEYDFTGVYMNDTPFAKVAGVNSRTHLYTKKAMRFVGDTTGHWSDQVVFKGDGRLWASASGASKDIVFEGITFDGFKASTDPLKEDSSNTDAVCLGGAMRGSGSQVATNCVFKNCKARAGGAVKGMTCRDCRFVTNQAGHHGGAGYNASFIGCTFEENTGNNGSGALWWPFTCENNRFLRNYTPGGAGAVQMAQGATVLNCYFEGNHAKNGGAVSTRQQSYITNCVFVDNYCEENGGAIVADDSEKSTSAGNGAWGSEVIGCAFTNNYSIGSANYRGGAISTHIAYTDDNKQQQIRGQIEIRDCDFYGNHAKYFAGAVWGGAISNCTFTANYIADGDYSGTTPCGAAVYHYAAASNCSTVVDSTFVSNTIVCAGKVRGAAIYNDASASKCERSVFFGNYLDNTNRTDKTDGKIVFSNRGGDNAYRIVDCAFTNNASYTGGIVNNAIITNTCFCSNDVPRTGACVIDCTVYDSVFVGNQKTDRHHPCDKCTADKKAYGGAIDAIGDAGVDAWDSKLYRCTMDGGMYLGCVINECVIPKCDSYGTWCVFRRDNYVTNTLIANAGGPTQRSLVYRWGSATDKGARSPWVNEFVNCTFADNLYIGGNGTAQRFLACGYPQSTTSRVFKTTLVNCAFNNNRAGNKSGQVRDLTAAIGKDADCTDPSVYADIIIAKNCAFGVAPMIVSHSNVNDKLYDYTDLGSNQVLSEKAQRLVKSDAQIATLGVAKYTPKGGSPLKGKGEASFYDEESKDAAGNLRVSGGKVDIGCYQSYLNPIPAMIWVK